MAGGRSAWQWLADTDRRWSAALTLPATSRVGRRLVAVGAHLGDSLLWLLVAPFVYLFGSPAVRQTVLVAGGAVLVAVGLTSLIKYRLRRQRPHDLGGFYSRSHDLYSFPSGHATRMAAIAVVAGARHPHGAAAWYALALLVAACRVTVGIHYLSDVLAGLGIGFAVAWAVVTLIQ